ALDASEEVIQRLGGTSDIVDIPAPPLDVERKSPETTALASGAETASPGCEVGEEVATRFATGEALVPVARPRPGVVALDGEVSTPPRAVRFAREILDRFVEASIAEQNMVGMAIGLARSGFHPYASSFAAFLSRAYDFIRMAPASQVDITLVGSHAGVSIGPDGPSQMGLEDIAAFR